MKLMQLLHWSEGERIDIWCIEDLVSITSLITNASDHKEIYKKAGDRLRSLLDEYKYVARNSAYGDRRRITVSLKLLLDFENYLILLLASINTKISDVLRIVSMRSYDKITFFEDQGIVHVKDGKLSMVGGGYIDIPPDIMKEHVPEIEKRFSKYGGKTQNSIASILFAKTTERGLMKIKEAYREFAVIANKALKSEKGNIPFIFRCLVRHLHPRR